MSQNLLLDQEINIKNSQTNRQHWYLYACCYSWWLVIGRTQIEGEREKETCTLGNTHSTHTRIRTHTPNR